MHVFLLVVLAYAAFVVVTFTARAAVFAWCVGFAVWESGGEALRASIDIELLLFAERGVGAGEAESSVWFKWNSNGEGSSLDFLVEFRGAALCSTRWHYTVCAL